jgi:hypothetical protein
MQLIPLLGRIDLNNLKNDRTRKISLKTILDSGTVFQKAIQSGELFFGSKRNMGNTFFF